MIGRKLVAGNWKMNGTRSDLDEIRTIADHAARLGGVDCALCVPFTLIAAAVEAADAVPIGAQDVHAAKSGAHTGCISAAMLIEAGASLTIVGHSERRTDQGEDDEAVKAKAEAAHSAGLNVILCIGETTEERDEGRAQAVVTGQLVASLPADAAGDWLSIAYEPIWAIGTGRTPTTSEVAQMHGAIRAALREAIGGKADTVRLLYGGSVTGKNAAALLSAGDVDGALVGGASLTAAKFAPILDAAAKLQPA